jgi:hypothetical protein
MEILEEHESPQLLSGSKQLKKRLEIYTKDKGWNLAVTNTHQWESHSQLSANTW